MWRVSSQAIASASRERVEHAQRHVLQVADRRRADEQPAGGDLRGSHAANIGSTGCRPSKTPAPQYTRYRARPPPARRARGAQGDRSAAERSATADAARPRRARRRRRRRRARRPLTPRAAARRALRRLVAAADAQTRRARPARADRRVARALARAVPDQLALRAHVAAVERRRRARSGRLSADVGEQHPRARLRPAPEGQQGTGRQHVGAEPLGLDHADAHRRRPRRAPVDPARHGASKSPATASRRSTRPTRSAARRCRSR